MKSKRNSNRLGLHVVPEAKPKIDRSPHVKKVDPFAKDRDALAGPNKGLVLRVMAFGMLTAGRDR